MSEPVQKKASATNAAKSFRSIDLFPIWKVLTQYNQLRFNSDIRAGLNVALLAFPQGMAYAMIAGLPIQYGIFCSAIATIIGPLFAGSRFIMLGPTNATSVLLFSTFLALGVSDAQKLILLPILLFLVATFQIIGSYLNVASLIQYVSRSVIVGYITAAALLIMASQIQHTLGFRISGASTFFSVIQKTFEKIPEAHLPTLILSLLTAVTYVLLKRFLKSLPNVGITLILMSMVGIGLNELGWNIQKLQAVSPSSWQISIPTFDLTTISTLASAAMAIAFLSILEGSSIGKSLAAMSGSRLNTNQELFSMGISNLGCSIFSGMPASGSLTRSVLNWTSGAATPLASVFCGFICIGLFLGLGQFIGFIPKASLSVVVVFVALSLINPRQIRFVIKTTPPDAFVFLVTFLSALLLPLDTAIYFGVGLSIILFLREAGEPQLIEYIFNKSGQLTQKRQTEERTTPEISIVHVEGSLFFGAAELLQEQIRRVCDDSNLKIIVLRLKHAHHLDASTILALEELVTFMKEHNRALIVSGARKDVYRICKRAKLIDIIGRENFFMEWPQNPTLSTRNALKRAQEILGEEKAAVRVFGETIQKKPEKT